jgi:hypothetical protein
LPPKAPHTDATRLSSIRNEQLAQLRELRVFRAENELDRAATYPRSLPYHFSVVVLVVVLEAVANMYLVAQGSELGLLGGIFEAFLLSITNVGVSVVVGMLALPQTNHRLSHRRLIAYLVFGLAIVFALFFNLAAAHYRDLLVVSKAVALEQALPRVFSQPFVISFDGLVLLALGLAVSALGFRKGYHADDIYPGYGAITRKYAEAKEAFLELRAQMPKASYPYPGVED